MNQLIYDIHKVSPDNSNILHKLMKNDGFHLSETDYDYVLDFLLKENVDATLIDSEGNSAAFYGLENNYLNEVDLIIEKKGVLKTSTARVFKAIKANTEKENKLLLTQLNN